MTIEVALCDLCHEALIIDAVRVRDDGRIEVKFICCSEGCAFKETRILSLVEVRVFGLKLEERG